MRRKGTRVHRVLGRIYLALMFVTALIALFMPARIGPTVLGRFGFIHLLCLLVLYTVPKAYFAALHHDVRIHRTAIISLRLLHEWIFGTL